MTRLFSNLLVSTPNDGGVIALIEDEVFRIDSSDTTGLDLHEHTLARGMQPDAVRLYKSDATLQIPLEPSLGDIHDVLAVGDRFYVVGTRGNAIAELSGDGEVLGRWVQGGQDDSCHVNCLALWQGRVIFSAFGDFEATRGYKAGSRGTGYVQDLLSAKRLIGGLSQPHSLTAVGPNLVLANSEENEIVEYDPDGGAIRRKALGGYTRGILIANGILYVGLSAPRHVERPIDGASAIVALDAHSWEELGRVSLPTREVYSIVSVANSIELAKWIARISSDSSTRQAAALVAADFRNAHNAQISEQLSAQLNQARADHGNVLAPEATSRQEFVDILSDLSDVRSELKTVNAHSLSLARSNQALRTELEALRKTRSWRATAPLRLTANYGRRLKGEVAGAAAATMRLLWQATPLPQAARVKAKSFVFKGLGPAIKGTRTYQNWRIHTLRTTGIDPAPGHSLGAPLTCLVVTTPHVRGLAERYAEALRESGFVVSVSDNIADQNRYEHLFVLCPQFFPGIRDGYIAIQLEQKVSRWFTADYIALLDRASAVIDYSVANIEFMKDKGIPFWKLFHVPIFPDATLLRDRRSPRDIDVLFYGDDQTPRRRELIAALRTKHRVHVENNLFGADMLEVIRRSKVVVNLHYYENALLEVPRIFEALSAGTPVVSEDTADVQEYPGINSAVDFVPTGNVDAISSAIGQLLNDDRRHAARRSDIEAYVLGNSDDFRFSFGRFLLSQNMIGYGEIPKGHTPEIAKTSEPSWCLTLAETPKRRDGFLSQHRSEFTLVNGLRALPGWVGCGVSYKYMFEGLAKADVGSATICEDDVLFPADFDARWGSIQEYLSKHNNWDVFSGFIADLSPDTKILRVEEYNGIRFLWLDRSVSMVFNVYSREAIQRLKDWNPDDRNVETNTIDRYMERSRMSVVVAYPFLVGHREDETSTIWGFHNSQYNDAVSRTHEAIDRRLSELVVSS